MVLDKNKKRIILLTLLVVIPIFTSLGIKESKQRYYKGEKVKCEYFMSNSVKNAAELCEYLIGNPTD
jgi:uncharacterized membrane protein